jgi:hypothetical protein
MKKLILAVALAIVGLFFGAGAQKAMAQNAALFTFNETPKALPAGEKYSVASVKEAGISIDLAELSRANAVKLNLPLFDGKTYRAQREEIEIRSLTDLTWRGKIREGKFVGDVILTLKNGYVAGLIYSPGTVYEIVPRGDRQILVQLDQRLFPECAGDIKGDPARESTSSSAPEAAIDSGDRIDVLVLYTTPVKNSLGGDAQAQAFAQSAIDVSNTTYRNSKIRQRVRLVNAQETAIAETGSLGSELPVLRGDSTTANLRTTFKADLVAMISNSSDNCGIGYLMGSVAGNSNNGFTVTSRTCAVGNLSFPHEMGHNMGDAHNPENGSGGTYSYSFGHWVNGSYRTVMSYVDQCTAGCVRHPYFSNPGVIFNGVPTGIANARDNARSMNNTADAIANYRYSGSSIQLTSFNGGEGLPRSVNRTLTWTSDNITGDVRIDLSRDESGTWTPLIASTPNDGSQAFSVPGPISRLIRLRVVSVNNTAVTDSSTSNLATR